VVREIGVVGVAVSALLHAEKREESADTVSILRVASTETVAVEVAMLATAAVGVALGRGTTLPDRAIARLPIRRNQFIIGYLGNFRAVSWAGAYRYSTS